MAELHILRPTGFINADTGADLRDRIHSLTVGDPRSVLIDCGAITFMDSSGFSCLITALKRLRRQGRELFLCSLNSQLRVILETTGTIQVFRIFPSSADCLLYLEQENQVDGERSSPAS
ncbi:STAS domain-containing protein [Synechococcus sp. CCY9201]|uniref:STAS domain-containing protein n=1 Tax=Synechococcus sp. CCY9201 TaxID=174697 RepID=UPI002B20C530|nr:STAS domain-containing protein [Synechococcus sp. CCY9201]MEA5475314.1 STAS domain-containing protein [Synechococcus sp. CCY9201]